MDLIVKYLSKESVPDFYRVNCETNGLGWCNCVAWWCSWNEFKDRTAEQNKTQREELFGKGQYDGYLLYDAGEPIGWSQCGPAGRLQMLCETYSLNPNASTWAITCFALAPVARKRGLAKKVLQLMLEDIKSRGVDRILGFPVRESEDPWTGPESVFKSAGFILEKDDKKIPIYSAKV